MRVPVTYVGELRAGYELPEQLFVVAVQGDQVTTAAEGHFKKVGREVDAEPAGLLGELLGASVHIARHETGVRCPVSEYFDLVGSDDIPAVDERFGALRDKHRDGVFQPPGISM